MTDAWYALILKMNVAVVAVDPGYYDAEPFFLVMVWSIAMIEIVESMSMQCPNQIHKQVMPAWWI